MAITRRARQRRPARWPSRATTACALDDGHQSGGFVSHQQARSVTTGCVVVPLTHGIGPEDFFCDSTVIPPQLHAAPEVQVAPLFAEHDVVVFSDYAKGALAHVEALITLARAQGIAVLVDPKGSDYQRYRGATLVTPNRGEMQQAVGHWSSEADLAERAQGLRDQLELEALLVTRSEQGMTLFTETGSDHVDAQAHEVFDVSGAGDTVLATLAVMRAIGVDWPEAMRWANRAGGIVVGKLGTSTVTAGELA